MSQKFISINQGLEIGRFDGDLPSPSKKCIWTTLFHFWQKEPPVPQTLNPQFWSKKACLKNTLYLASTYNDLPALTHITSRTLQLLQGGGGKVLSS
jgi:hypothetical protein